MKRITPATVVVAIVALALGFGLGAGLVLTTEVRPLRAQLAHYREVAHVTPELCVSGEVRP
jgi:hypothetical protein